MSARFTLLPRLVTATFLAAASLSPARAEWAPVVGTSCTPLPPVGDLSIAQGSVAASRLNALQGGASDVLGPFVRWAFEQGQARSIEKQVSDLDPEIRKMLDWSGAKGVLVAVGMQRDTGDQMPPRLQWINIYGAGNCPYDVLVASSQSGPAVMNPGPQGGSYFDEDSSFFYWVVKSGSGLRRSVVTPGSRGPLLQKARADAAVVELLKKNRYVDESQRLLALAAEARRQSTDNEVKKILADAQKRLADSSTERARIQAELDAALKAQESAAGAHAWVSQAQGVIAVAQLAVQVKVMIAPAAPTSTVNAVDKAGTDNDPVMLDSTLGAWVKESSDRVVSKQGELEVVLESYKKTSVIIIDRAKNAGAPQIVLP